MKLVRVALRGVLVVGMALLGLIQWFFVELSGDYAESSPEFAYARWPVLIMVLVAIGGLQMGIVCVWRLLDLTANGRVFSRAALPWVNATAAAPMVTVVASAAYLLYSAFVVREGVPANWLAVIAVIAGLVVSLLMLVMRDLLVQATRLRDDMDEVI